MQGLFGGGNSSGGFFGGGNSSSMFGGGGNSNSMFGGGGEGKGLWGTGENSKLPGQQTAEGLANGQLPTFGVFQEPSAFEKCFPNLTFRQVQEDICCIR